MFDLVVALLLKRVLVLCLTIVSYKGLASANLSPGKILLRSSSFTLASKDQDQTGVSPSHCWLVEKIVTT